MLAKFTMKLLITCKTLRQICMVEKCFSPVIDIACRREFLCFVFRGICSTDEIVQQRITRYVLPLAKAYLEMYHSALEIREFFGLRDFYR